MPLSEKDRAWWHRPDDELEDEDPKANEKLHNVIHSLEQNQDHKLAMLLYGAMYSGGVPPIGGGMGVDSYVRTSPNNLGNLSLNLSRTCVDAVVSRIFSKSEPKLSYVTEGGDYERQDNAKKLEQGVEGAFYLEGASDVFVQTGRNGAVFGTGFTRVEPNFDERKIDIVKWMPWEIIIDDTETLVGEPRSWYTARYYDKGVLEYRFREEPEKAEMIRRLDSLWDEDAQFGYTSTAVRLRVEEAWHRPSGREATDGRHVMGVKNVTLLDEPWDGGPLRRPWRFATYRWSKPLVGFYGQGLVELGAGIQAEINKIMRDIQLGLKMIKGHWVVEESSKVRTAHLNNDLTTILRYAGTAPVYQAPGSIIPTEEYTHLWNLVAKYYELAGLNQQTTSAQKPAGLQSGEAQRVYADQQTEVLLQKGKDYEEYVKDVGQLVTDAAKALSKKGAYEVRAFDDDGFESIDWKQLDDPDGYELRVHPTSSLPGTPSGKIQLAYDMQQIGEFDSADVMEIVGMPDIIQKTRQKLASRKLVEKKVGEMLRGGPLWIPTTFLNTAEASVIATQMLCEAEEKGVDDERLENVREFILACDKITQTKPAPAAPNVATSAPMLAPGQAGATAAPPAPGPMPAQGA